MASTVLIFKVQVSKIDTLELDAVTSESHKEETEITEHPVEVGANITDHARLKPIELTMQGIISNTPVNATQQRRIIQSRGVTFETIALADSPVGSAIYVEAALAKLEKLRIARQLITVVTSLPGRTYQNMMLTSLVIPRDPKTGDALTFTANFKEIVFANLRKAEVQVHVEKKANAKVKLGKQTTPDEGHSNDSIFTKIDNSTDGFLSNHLGAPKP